jgi:hypothetical protein
MLRTALAILAIIIAANALQATHSKANAGGRYNEAGTCHWFLKQAMNTSDEYWWYRYRSCMRGW